MMNTIQTIVAVGKLTGTVASATKIAPSVAPMSGMKSKNPTTRPSASAYGTPRIERTIQVAIVARTLMMMLPSM